MTREEAERWLRAHFEAGLERKVDRYLASRVHTPIPHLFLSAASSECRDHFVDGDFYGCITLAQSVAEGLSKFLAEKKGIPIKKDFEVRVQRLRQAGVITPAAEQAFLAIHGADRNDFHHLNKNIEQDYLLLEKRAGEIIANLYQIESEVFGDGLKDGAIIPTFPEYWPSSEPGTLNAWMRS